MKEIISKKTTRHLTIIYQLSVEQKKLSIADIQKLNKCSVKTVYDDIDFIFNHYNEVLNLTINNGLIYSNYSTTSDLHYIKKDYYHNETILALLQAIFLFPHKKIVDYAIMLDVSESTIASKIKNLNKLMNDFAHITYDDEQEGYYIYAKDELQFQYFLLHILKETEDKKTIKDYIICVEESDFYSHHKNFFETLNAVNETTIPDSIAYQQATLTSLEFIRAKQGYPIRQSFLLEISQKKLVLLEKALNQYIDQAIAKERYLIEYSERLKIIYVFKVYYLKSQFLRNYHYHKFSRAGIFKSQFKKTKFDLFQQLNFVIDELDQLLTSNLKDYLAEILFSLYTSVPNIQKQPSYRIGIISDLGYDHAQALYSFLIKHFSDQSFTIISDPTLEVQEIYDFIVTNSVVIQYRFSDYDRFIKVSDFPLDNDLKNIYKKLHLTIR